MKRFIASFILVGVCLFSAAQSSYVSVSLERSSLSLSYSMLRSNYGGGVAVSIYSLENEWWY